MTKHACLAAFAFAAATLMGCNMQNNGEMPPPHELPAPMPAQSTPSGPAAAPAATASQGATTTAASSQGTTAAYRYDAAKGKDLFSMNCSACHQETGLGVPGAFPPLKGNPVVANPDPTQQIQTILDGAHGTAIDGKKYSGVMPPFAGNFSDTDIANIANYERSSWGNTGKHVTAAQVAAVRGGGKAK